MKKIYKYTLLLIAAFLFVPFSVKAQSAEDVIGLNKTVDGPNEDGGYTITLETFVTGSSVTTVTDITVPCDIVLVLDHSMSMSSNSITLGESQGTEVTSGNLDRNTTYYIKINGVNYYLRRVNDGGTGYAWYYGSNNPPTASDTFIYRDNNQTTPNEITSRVAGATGIYRIVTETKTRLEIMTEAAREFVNTVYANGTQHRIGVLTYNGPEGTGTIANSVTEQCPLTLVDTETARNTVRNSIPTNRSNQGSYTHSEHALHAAYNMLNTTSSSGRQLVTVFFTDGQPANSNQGTRFNAAIAREAVNWADQLKALATHFTYHDNATDQDVTIDLTSKVYSVAILSSETSDTNTGNNGQGSVQYDIRRFLHYVSSNYNTGMPTGGSYYFQENYTNAGGGDEAPHDFYQLSDGSDLTAIFKSIANETSSGGASYQLSTSSVVTVDIVSSYFMLPEGAQADDIEIYLSAFSDYTDKDDKSTYIFDDANMVLQDTIHTEIGKNAAQQDTIGVSGFDFAKNWCGKDVISGTSNWHAHGYKMVIKIPIVVDVQNPGGASLKTNDAGSGIYVDGQPLIYFPQPTVTLPNIIIRKFGMLYENEAASFRLEKLKQQGSAWVVDEDVEPYYIVVVAKDSDPATFDFVQVKLQYPGRYRVTETDWGWSYNCTARTSFLTGETPETHLEGYTYQADMGEKNISGDLITTSSGTYANGQPYIDRDVSGDTEQTITLPDGANTLAGAVYDFRNVSKQHEKRNYSEAHKLNEFKTTYNPVEK